MAITKRAGRKGQTQKEPPPKRGGGVKKATFDTAKKKEVGVSDLTLLSKVSDEAINENLHKRFQNGIIYTYIGHVLISVNPFRDLGIYTEEVLLGYKGKNRLEVPPHVFAIAEAMYYNMNAYKENQCVIISGESGAGKTEAAKRIMQYIASVSGGSASSGIQKIKDMVLATNPLLESFGCAKTLRNDNSSRHGKYLEILFNHQGEPIGANITNYLLEKGRVVGQIRNERNFHIFYQYSKGASQSYREAYGVQMPEAYTYTSASKCTSVQSIDDVADFKETLNAMNIIGLSQQEQDDIFKLLAAILWIGNITFVENQDGGSDITDSSVTNFVAYLLDVNAESIEKALTIRVVETTRGGRRGSVYESPLNPVQAAAVRDALAKGIYNNLFDWIVARVNNSLQSAGAAAAHTIGILDIYGFEIFENNSFEQICINYVNEKLQQIFIELTLKTEQEEYVREKIQWTPIKYFNNKVVCDLIEERRPPGIFSVLNDACATAHADPAAADQNFSMKLGMLSSNTHLEQRQGKFIIKHYAGDVTYDVNGMTDKNKDQMQKDLLLLLAQSQNQFLHTLFPEQVDTDSRKRPPTASDKIKQSANALMTTLGMARPSYIRTIKPNQNRSPTEYDTAAVLHQVKYLGLNENVRIRRAGFAYRQDFDKFVERFYLLSPKTSYAGDYIWKGDSHTATLEIFKDTGIPSSEYQMGVTKAFIKTPETLFALEHMRDMYWHNMAARIQRAWRHYLRHKAECATKIQRFWREIKGRKKYVELRDKGHAILAGRKERRRMSLLGYRRFWGDYLACNVASSPGGFLLRSLGITEKIRFSSRGELLHAKFGRSSQRLSRIFLLSSKSFYIIMEEIVQNKLQYVIERTIAVSTIRSIAMSNLRDDWFAFRTSSSQEPEPFLWCVFKTELATLLGVQVTIADTVQYNKKPGKPTTVKFQKDATAPPYFDLYKSSTVHVPQGQPANSVSEPVPKPKPRAGKPATKATPRRTVPAASRPAAAASRQQPQAIPLPGQSQVQAPAQTPYSQAPQQASTTTTSSSGTPTAAKRVSRQAPPPPPPTQTPGLPRAKALYDYAATRPSELGISVGEIVFIAQKTETGWWLADKLDKSAQGWVPAAYVEEIASSPSPAKRAPPPAPPKKKLNGNGSAPAPAGAGGPNLASGLADALRQRNQDNSALAGGLADALKARSGRRDDDDDDDDW